MNGLRWIALGMALTCAPALGEDNPFATWKTCPTSRTEFSSRLSELRSVARLFDQLSDDQKMDLVMKPGWQGTYLLHFDTAALPENLISAVASTCWAYFYEASLATQASHWIEADKAAAVWQACVTTAYREETPDEVHQIRRCFAVARQARP